MIHRKLQLQDIYDVLQVKIFTPEHVTEEPITIEHSIKEIITIEHDIKETITIKNDTKTNIIEHDKVKLLTIKSYLPLCRGFL